MSNKRRKFSYRDLMNLVHPKPRDELREEIFEKIVKGELDDYPDVEPLKQHGTWEDSLSEAGQDDDKTKADAYRDRLDRMGLKATVMQTRDMIDAGLDPEEFLTDDLLDQVSDGGLWPFKYYIAHKAIRQEGYDSPHVDRWFEQAVEESVSAVPDDLSETYTAADLSGSMNRALARKSVATRKDISALFGAICAKKGAKVTGFATDFTTFDFHIDTPALQAVETIKGVRIGGNTHGYKAIDYLIENDIQYENVAIFTDMQIWGRGSVKDSWDRYTNEVAPDANLYMIDLAHYGDLTMPEGYNNVFRVSGWNENVIRHIKHASQEDEAIRQVEEHSNR